MSARSGLVGKRTSRSHLGPLQAMFPMDRTIQKHAKTKSISLGGPLLLFTLGGALGIPHMSKVGDPQNMAIAARAPCSVLDSWARWERGQFGI